MPQRSAIVTGGGQGIGKAIALDLVHAGWNVAVAEIDEEAGRELRADTAVHDHLLVMPCDVAREDDVNTFVAAAAERFGRLDLLVNNAAIMHNRPINELALDAWNRVIGVNLTGPFLCSRAATPHLSETGGSIINIASTRALMSEADTEAYSASKGGLVALTHALAVSLGPAVRVNCISPGWIEVAAWKRKALRSEPLLREEDHAQHPVGRVGRPEDVVGMVRYLASDAAGFITGQNFIIDGGMTHKMIYVE